MRVGGNNLYQSKLLVTGLCTLSLGIGNWFMGSLKFTQYQRIVEEGMRRGFNPRPPGPGSVINVLRPDSEEGERYNMARARVDLYHVVLSGGRLMVFLGVLLAAIGWIRIRWKTSGQSLLPTTPGDLSPPPAGASHPDPARQR